MVNIDRSKLHADHRNLPINPKLEEFINQVSLAKPLCEFSFGEHSVRINYDYTKDPTTKTPELYKIEVRQDGELLGGLFVSDRYFKGAKEDVYGVESFRIQKERGRGDATLSKNLKVAMRNAKKSFVSRADDELRKLIKEQVTNSIYSVWSTSRNGIVYGMDAGAEALSVAMLAYQARLKGETIFTAPAMPASIKRIKQHDKECESFATVSFLKEQLDSGLGYGVSVYSNGSLAVLNFADQSVSKFKSAELLPLDIQSKLAMFKVIEVNEPYSHLGCKFNNDMFYIVAGDMGLEN